MKVDVSEQFLAVALAMTAAAPSSAVELGVDELGRPVIDASSELVTAIDDAELLAKGDCECNFYCPAAADCECNFICGVSSTVS